MNPLAPSDRCGKCQYYHEEETGPPTGFCHLNPPVLVVQGENMGWVRPIVHPEGHCCGFYDEAEPSD